MNNCKIPYEVWVDRVLGVLPDSEVRDLDLHAQACIRCKKQRKELLAIKVLSKGSAIEMPTDDFFNKLENKVMKQVEKTYVHSRPRKGVAQWVGAAAAACLVLIVTTFVARHEGSKFQSRPVLSETSSRSNFEDLAAQTPDTAYGVILAPHSEDEMVMEMAAQLINQEGESKVKDLLFETR